MEWKLHSGEPNKMRVSRCIKQLKDGKLITETNYRLTDRGKSAVNGDDTD